MANGNGTTPATAPQQDLTAFAGGSGLDLSAFAQRGQLTQQTPQQPAQHVYPTIASDPTSNDLPRFEAGNEEIAQRPLSWGMKVASPDYVQQFNSYLQQGGDINRVPIEDQIGVALAKDPDFFKKNPDAFYNYVYKPLDAQQKLENPGTIFNKAVASIPGMLWNIGKGVVDMTVNSAKLTADSEMLMFRKATGFTSGQDYQDLVSRLATENATAARGIADAITTNGDLINNVAYTIANSSKPLAKLFANSPESQEQIDRGYSQLLLNKASTDQDLLDVGKNLQQTAAQAYKATGMFADLGEKMKTAAPNESAVSGYATAWNPLNFMSLGEGATVVGAARPILFERGLEAGEDLAGAISKKTSLDITQVLPKNPELDAADPAYITVRNAQAQLAGQARNAAQDVSNAQNVLNSRLTTIGRISGDPGTVTSFAANALQTVGNIVQGVANLAKAAQPENLAHLITGGDPFWKPLVQTALEKTVFGGALEHFGPIGGAIEAAFEKAPDIGSAVASLAKTMGQELTYADSHIPYFTRVAMQNKLMPKGLAAALDSPLVQTAVQVGKAGGASAATGAAIGGLGGGIPGAVAGAVQGGLLGMAGGGFGQWQRFQDPNQYLLAARSDWKRYSDLLSPTEAQQFRQLSPTNQLMIAQNAMHFPGLRIDYFNDPKGVRGSHYVDQGGASHIQVNVANPQSAIAGIAAHELTHAATHSGMVTELYDTHFGNPVTGEIGQFTALGPDGKPVGIDPVTQRYQTNQEFQNLKNQYVNALAQSGVPTAHLTDFDISREIYAEHGVDYLMGGGSILDSNSAFRPGLYSKNALKTALAKIGYTFDNDGRMIGAPNGTISGTGLFTDLQRNPDLNNFAQAYHTKQWQEGMMASEEMPTRNFTKKDLQNPNVTETWLNNAPEIVRNPDGTAQRDPNTGLPIMRSPNEVKRYNANFAEALRKGLESLPQDQRADLGYRQTVDAQGRTNVSVRYLPDNVLDSLAATNQYNPHQIASLRMLSRVLADGGNPGMEMRMFYRSATTPSKRYGTFAGNERLAVPYSFEITHDNNVNIKSVDFQQLDQNYLRVRNRAPYKSLWDGPSSFTQDAHTYFTNHKEGRPGSDAIGEAKRDAINALAGFGTEMHRNANPLVDQMPGSVRPIIKSFAIDRANQISATGAMRPFISEAQYYAMNRNYLPGAPESVSYRPSEAAPGEAAPPDQTAIPVTMRTTASGKVQPEQFDYGITKAPLVADKQPPANLKGSDNNFEHVDFLTKPDQQRLTHLDKASAVTDYADKIVGEYGKWQDNKEVMAAKKWYDTVRGFLKKGFGGDQELFAHLLAATSPQQGVVQNWRDALEAYRQYRSGAYDDAIREYKRTGKITEDMKPTKANGAKFGANSDAVLKVLAGTWLDSVEGPKTPNFFANLFGRGTDATIDKWAARTMRRLGYEGVEDAPAQWRLTPPSEKGVSDLDFAFSQQAFKQAADRVGMKPHQLQAIMWYAEKHLWAERGWSKGGAAAAKASYIPMLKEYAANPEVAPLGEGSGTRALSGKLPVRFTPGSPGGQLMPPAPLPYGFRTQTQQVPSTASGTYVAPSGSDVASFPPPRPAGAPNAIGIPHFHNQGDVDQLPAGTPFYWRDHPHAYVKR